MINILREVLVYLFLGGWVINLLFSVIGLKLECYVVYVVIKVVVEVMIGIFVKEMWGK